MIQINSMSTLATAHIPKEIKEYLTDYIDSVLSANNTNNLTKCGCIYFLETHQDTQNFNDLGLRQPLKDTPFEYCEFIPIYVEGRERLNVFHALHLRNNDFAIEIFGDQSILDSETRKAFEENIF